ncbi:MAG TPA: hypothetical protein VM163_00550 [bacterium]|nr:hypothetical protein [bacterium]
MAFSNAQELTALCRNLAGRSVLSCGNDIFDRILKKNEKESEVEQVW